MASTFSQNVGSAVAGAVTPQQPPQTQTVQGGASHAQISQAAQKQAKDQIAKAVPDNKRVAAPKQVNPSFASQKNKGATSKAPEPKTEEEPRNANGKYDVVA
jgi:hypothetical protein